MRFDLRNVKTNFRVTWKEIRKYVCACICVCVAVKFLLALKSSSARVRAHMRFDLDSNASRADLHMPCANVAALARYSKQWQFVLMFGQFCSSLPPIQSVTPSQRRDKGTQKPGVHSKWSSLQAVRMALRLIWEDLLRRERHNDPTDAGQFERWHVHTHSWEWRLLRWRELDTDCRTDITHTCIKREREREKHRRGSAMIVTVEWRFIGK